MSFYEDFERLTCCDWREFDRFFTSVEDLLYKLSKDKKLLSILIKNAVKDPYFLKFSGETPLLKKLVLYKDRFSGVELRLHIFKDAVRDFPHNHRLSFSTMILHGAYKHTLLTARKEIDTSLKFEDLSTLLHHLVKEGHMYSIHHEAIHMTEAIPETISLILRGPFMKERWFNIDPHKNTPKFYGDSNLPKPFSTREIRNLLNFLSQKNLIDLA